MNIQIIVILLLALVNAQTGGWKKFINEAQVAIQNKYQLEEQGFEFEQVVSIETQKVAGTNYNIVLQYGNEEGQTQQYNVVIYSEPWNSQDQITKCEQIDRQSASFLQNQWNNNKNQQQQKISNPLRLLARNLESQNSPMPGGWFYENPKAFLKKEKYIIDRAYALVSREYNPKDEGYEFHKILEVQAQVVAGMNYNITLLYSNGEGSYQKYLVYIYDRYVLNLQSAWDPVFNTERADFIETYSGPLTGEIQCECENFTSQTECNNFVDCIWETSCTKKACKDVTACDTSDECLINNFAECEAFHECSNYEVSKPFLCMIQKGNCEPASTPNANGKYACAGYTPVANCSQLAITDCKKKHVVNSYFCWLNASTNKCDKFYMDSCSGIPMDVCADLGCDATGTTCKAFTCASFNTEASCTVAKDGIFGTYTLCKWDVTAKSCGDRSDTSDYTQDTCSNKTNGGYYWSDNQCVACKIYQPSEDLKGFGLLFLLPAILAIIQ